MLPDNVAQFGQGFTLHIIFVKKTKQEIEEIENENKNKPGYITYSGAPNLEGLQGASSGGKQCP